MSAFIVEEDTINEVLSWLHTDAALEPIAACILKDAGFDCRDLEKLRGLGHEMFRMNIYAVDARYGDGEGMDMGGACGYNFRIVDVTAGQALMSLACWGYQCAEGDIPERPLYKVMEQVEEAMKDAGIVWPENGRWG